MKQNFDLLFLLLLMLSAVMKMANSSLVPCVDSWKVIATLPLNCLAWRANKSYWSMWDARHMESMYEICVATWSL